MEFKFDPSKAKGIDGEVDDKDTDTKIQKEIQTPFVFNGQSVNEDSSRPHFFDPDFLNRERDANLNNGGNNIDLMNSKEDLDKHMPKEKEA